MKFLKYFAVLATVAILSGCFFNKDKPSSPDEIDFSKCENIDTSNDCPTRNFKNIKSGYNDCKI